MNLPAPRLRFREPGLSRLDPGVERYRLAGLGGLILHLFAGDRVEIVDRGGGTPLPAPPLPEPLGDLVAEYHVPRCTAISYAVKEGQYIQVIDAEGRQCSDFLAFDAKRLQARVERGLDMTTTRTLL